MDKTNTQPRMPEGTHFLMVSVAIFVDVTQVAFSALHLIPAVGTFFALVFGAALSFLAWLTFYTWYKARGVSFLERMGARRILTVLVIPLLEVTLPIIPGWTLFVFLTNSIVKAEDALVEKGIISREALNALIQLSERNFKEGIREILKKEAVNKMNEKRERIKRSLVAKTRNNNLRVQEKSREHKT